MDEAVKVDGVRSYKNMHDSTNKNQLILTLGIQNPAIYDPSLHNDAYGA